MHITNGLGHPITDDDIEGAPVDEITEEVPLPFPSYEDALYITWQRPVSMTRQSAGFVKLMQLYDEHEQLFFTHLGGVALCHARLHRFSSSRDATTAAQQVRNYIGYLFADLSRHGREVCIEDLNRIMRELIDTAGSLGGCVPNGSITAFHPVRIWPHQVMFRGTYYVA